MRHALAVLLLAVPASAADRVLHVPPGFEIQKVAGPPLVERPVAVAFDNKGRLYVTESSGSNEPAKVQLEKKPHRVLRLTDTNGDGVFDTSTVFADKMMFPQGVMWLNGSVYVGAPPHIWKLTDTDDDGVADKREIWFDGKTLTGCLNDLHGPYAGPDGYIYWTKGAFAQQEYTLPNGKPFKTRAAHVFRAKPDGTGIEPVFTAGMDNPVDVAFGPAGDLFVSGTFFQHPADGKRDGLIHAVHGGIWGKDHDVIRDPVHKWTSPHLMEPMTHLGPAAPCGLHCYTHTALGAEYRDNLFACQFNLRTVSRHILKPHGSTFSTEDSRFVWSDDMDFHPTDVIAAANGSLIVVDTGGWYKLCCPSSQLVKTDVTGAVYRVRKARAEPAEPAKPLISQSIEERYRKRPFFDSVWSWIGDLDHPDLHVRRRAAAVIGRNAGSVIAVPALLKALADARNDHVLDHALTYALIEIDDPKETAAGLTHASPKVRAAALVALDGMTERLTYDTLAPFLSASEPKVRDTAWWVAGRHPEWGDKLADHFRRQLARNLTSSEHADEFAALRDRLAQFAASPAVQQLLADAVINPDTAILAFQVMSKCGLKTVPTPWHTAFTTVLKRDRFASDVLPVWTLRKLPRKNLPPELLDALRSVTARPKEAENVRLLALATLPDPTTDDALFESLILSGLKNEQYPLVKAAALDAVAEVRFTPAQLAKLAELLPAFPPTERPRFLAAFARSTDPAAGRALLAALHHPKVRPSLRTEVVKPILDKYPAAVQTEAAKLYAELEKARAGERERLETIAKELPAGDVRRGQVIFNSVKAACATCHKIGYVGGTVGPDLTKIGGIRTERDLLESIVFPSASFVRSYEPVRLSTKDGAVHQGILKSDSSGEVLLTIAADKEVRVKKEDIEEMAPGAVSVMPAGLDGQLTRQELADLITFLKGCK